MTESRAFCPRCGAPVPERPPAGEAVDDSADSDAAREDGTTAADPLRPSAAVELCDACYFEDFAFVDAPEHVEVTICSRCGAVERGSAWEDVGDGDQTEIAIEAVTDALSVHVDVDDVSWGVEPEQVDRNTIRMHCHFSGRVRDEIVEETVVVPVTIGRGICLRCGRIAGDYYASIVQLRATDRTPTSEEVTATEAIANDVVAEMEATGDRNAFITEASEVDDGLDIKVSTTKIGKKIANRVVERFGGTVSDSETLVTEDEDGNEVYRVTYAVRLPPFIPGDVIELVDDGGPVLVRSARGNLKGLRVTTGERYEASYEEGIAPNARKLGTVDDAEETTLVTVEDDHAIQVLDPETYEAKTIARPEYVDPHAETIPVLKSRAGLHALPDDDRA